MTGRSAVDLASLRRSFWHLRHGGPEGLRRHRRRRATFPAGPRPSAEDASGVAPWPTPTPTPRRPRLRVATVLDEFSARSFEHEWDQVAVTPGGWREELSRTPVELLFVESAWAGNDRAWQYLLTGSRGPSDQLRDLVARCRELGVPTVFWNKEDPVHHEDFLEAARLFDHVLTTDDRLLDTYRAELGHDRVGVLTFAAQPAIHSPVRLTADGASRDVAFAGMYFAHRHPERAAQMDMLLGAAADVSGRMEHGLEIFSRQLGGDERYQFPAPLDRHVVGSLDYPRMLTAYRSYKVFLNVNTVVDSPTMCARRIFEITASGTPVVSTPSPAITAVFPRDEVVQVSERDEAAHTVRALVASPELRDRMVHRAQRRIWSAHTTSHRVDDVLATAGLDAHVLGSRSPRVSALVATRRPEQLDHVLDTVAAQRGVDVQLVLLTHGWEVEESTLRQRASERGVTDVVLLRAGTDVPLGACLNRLAAAADGDLVAKIDDDDLYGPHYLADQAHALTYSGADVVGKQAHYVHLVAPDLTALRFGHREHRFTDRVTGPTIVTRRELVLALPFPPLRRGEDTGFLDGVARAGARLYSADRFSFVQVRGSSTHTWTASDAEILASSEVVISGPPLPHAFA
ncbi:glycosyltransferase [Serinibacter arcticus]|uniref:Glycosyltransferase n=1 Tax=Serinibacter arcticus TaxID=1655435 RepID=A0A2U1ZV98_9MICO|nr:glycosyltransferase [Serinibacter arcticus]PWD50870.1 glycosyltransferase [Serinibacter arcticus]